MQPLFNKFKAYGFAKCSSQTTASDINLQEAFFYFLEHLAPEMSSLLYIFPTNAR